MNLITTASFTSAEPKHVDFRYAIAPPHRMTVGRPSNSKRTMLDLEQDNLRLSWTYHDLTQLPLATCRVPKDTGITWAIKLTPQIDGKPFSASSWARSEGWLPVLDNRYDDPRGAMRLEVAGGHTAAIVRVDVSNTDNLPHRFTLACKGGGNKGSGYNMAWVDPDRWAPDNQLAFMYERADRVVAAGVGADTWWPDKEKQHYHNMVCTLHFVFDLEPGEKKTGWLILPHSAYEADLPKLRTHDWNQELESAKAEWRELLSRTSRITIPDSAVANALKACLADLFIMREPVAGGYTAFLCGTELYRSTNSAEPSVAAIALDQFGFHNEAQESLRLQLEMQGADGEWADPQGWCISFWSAAGFKSWAAMEHYRLTGDRQYLGRVYSRMAASARWQEQQRSRTRILVDGSRPLHYGLMPRGVGDCGLKNDCGPNNIDIFGHYIPHNIWSVFADQLAVEAAEILGRTEDLDELRQIYKTAHTDLVQAMERGAIQEDAYRWIPGVPGKTCGSRWGVLNAAFPCRLLPPEHELITGTIQKFESLMSPGGIPMNTGWMPDGMWVAMALDNLAETLLLRNAGDDAADYLYPVLNHGTPLFTWCEERGSEPGTQKFTGDPQHLWTPLAVVRFIRDAMVMEDGKTLHLGRGLARQWLGSGCAVGVEKMPTHFGNISWELRYDKATRIINGSIELPANPVSSLILHIRLPDGLTIGELLVPSGGALGHNGTTVEWENPIGAIYFSATTIIS